MGKEIIYEKKYPRTDWMEEFMKAEPATLVEPNEPGNPEEAESSFKEFMEKMQANTTYVLIPERVKASEEFIRRAIEVSELYELDTKIERHVDRICVNYAFNCGGGMRFINRVFGMADEVSFFKDIDGWDIVVSLDFCTHATLRNGRVVSP